MKKHYLLLLAMAASFTFVSCDDDDEVTPTKTELLTSKTWSISERVQTMTDSSGTTTDNSLDACEKDDTYTFTTDNKLNFDEGATKCNPSDPQTSTGSWTLSDNDTKLTLVSSGLSIPGELLELTASKMVVKSTLDFGGTIIVNTSTFTAR